MREGRIPTVRMDRRWLIPRVVRRKAARGRILVGDETSDATALRAEEEGTTGGLQGRIQLHRRYLRDLDGVSGVEVRAHGTTLYNSLFRFDQDLLVNGHAWGAPAGQSPVLHLHRVPAGGPGLNYIESFERLSLENFAFAAGSLHSS